MINLNRIASRSALALGVAGMLMATGCRENTSDMAASVGQKGLRLDYMDTTVSPRENFFLYANGGYISQKEIPAEESRWGTFNELRDVSEERVNTILKEASTDRDADPSSLAFKIGAFTAVEWTRPRFRRLV